jgi:hypothetical protein
LYPETKCRNLSFRKNCSGFKGKIRQVSLAIGNPYLEDFLKAVTALKEDQVFYFHPYHFTLSQGGTIAKIGDKKA